MAVTAVVVRSVLRCRRYDNQRGPGMVPTLVIFCRRDRCRKLAYLIAGGRASVEAQFDRAISEALLPENG